MERRGREGEGREEGRKEGGREGERGGKRKEEGKGRGSERGSLIFGTFTYTFEKRKEGSLLS